MQTSLAQLKLEDGRCAPSTGGQGSGGGGGQALGGRGASAPGRPGRTRAVAAAAALPPAGGRVALRSVVPLNERGASSSSTRRRCSIGWSSSQGPIQRLPIAPPRSSSARRQPCVPCPESAYQFLEGFDPKLEDFDPKLLFEISVNQPQIAFDENA